MGRLYVLLDTDPPDDPNSSSTAERALTAVLLEEMRGRVRYLEGIISTRAEEIRKRDVIISQLTQRIPELESGVAQEPVGERQSTQKMRVDQNQQDGSDGAVTRETQAANVARPWWRRLFAVE